MFIFAVFSPDHQSQENTIQILPKLCVCECEREEGGCLNNVLHQQPIGKEPGELKEGTGNHYCGKKDKVNAWIQTAMPWVKTH